MARAGEISAQGAPEDGSRIYLPFASVAKTQQFEVESQVGGLSEAIAVWGDRSFVGAGPRVMAFDHSSVEEGRLDWVATSPILPGIVSDIALGQGGSGEDTWLAVAMGEAGVAILDASQPSRLQLRSVLRSEQPAQRLASVGSMVYVSAGGLHRIDLLRPDRMLPVVPRDAVAGDDCDYIVEMMLPPGTALRPRLRAGDGLRLGGPCAAQGHLAHRCGWLAP